MEELFATYEQSVALEKLGYKGITFAGWNHPWMGNKNPGFQGNPQECEYDIDAPLKSQVFKWFREVHNLSGIPTDESYEIWRIWRLPSGISRQCIIEEYPLTSFEEAEEDCINKLIELVTDGKI
jgi:hypothetical protein